MLISPEKKILFFHIPKTAGSSIYDTLKKVCPDSIDFEKKLTYQYAKNTQTSHLLKIDHHVDQETLKKIFESADINVSGYFEFSIVRHPYDRLMSQYNYTTRSTSNKKDLKFENFLDLFENNDSFWYKNQLSWVINPITKNFKFYKYEELADAWIDIKRRTGAMLPNLPCTNMTKEKKITNLSSAEKDRIYTMFRNEFDYLGYKR